MELTKEWAAVKLPKRPKGANKGTFGKVLVMAGSANYPGAAYLSCAAAYRVGAGLTTLVTEEEVKIIVSRKLPEVTFLSYSEAWKRLGRYDVLLVGPGLGQSDQAVKLVKQLVAKDLPPTIIDGDGLNILAKMGQWWESLIGEIILTPHPGEMARLTGLSIDQIQKDRVNAAQSYAKKWKRTVVLKGANTVIADRFGQALISPFTNPVLATAGTGDVLSGITAGMLAQGLEPMDAAGVSVCIHGLAGEKLRQRIGNAGVLASDLLPVLPRIIRELI